MLSAGRWALHAPTRTPAALCVLAITLLSTPSLAQDNPNQPAYNTLLETCYAQAPDPASRIACSGIVQTECMAEPGGETTLGMSMCAHSETQAWDVLLNREYRETMAWMKSMDAEDQTHFPEFATREETLRTAQRAWLAFREAECGLEYAIWGAGSMRHIAGSACYADMTAARTHDLRDMRELMQ